MLEIIVDEHGNKRWFFSGILHREDGPAIKWADLVIQWWLNGEILTKEAWFEMLPEDLKMKALFSEHFLGNR